ncbi:MAG: hypothetical protein NT040_08940 [Bacteroidetes bacterium]|nr:hypothetical protein [Bacteroidota bacterium]
MKTQVNNFRWFLILVLAVSAIGAMAENTNPTQTVCIGSQYYHVTDIPGATFTWTLPDGGGTFTTPNGVNEITVDWTTAGGPYTLSVFSTLNGCPGPEVSVEVTVVPAPVGPTLLATSQPYPDVCSGSDVWATFTAGSGGVGCTDEFEYSYDNVTWVAYTPAALIPTAGQLHVYIHGRRSGCDATLGCNGTNWVLLATWNITTLQVTVSIVANPNPVCAGTQVTFTATPVNGGLTPVYTWRVNGTVVPGVTINTYTYVPTNGDVVDCDLTSSESCGAPIPATSNAITVTVNPVPITSPIFHN